MQPTNSIGTKLRALSQRRKGRDLFDLAADIGPLLAPGFDWHVVSAAATVLTNLIERLPGAPFKKGSRRGTAGID